MQIWDIAGQERFRNYRQPSYRGTHGVIIAFDLTDRVSFDNVKQWYIEVDRYAPYNITTILVGTKSDISSSEQAISSKEAKDFANQYNLTYIETSAKNGSGVEEAFETLTTKIYEEKFRKEEENVVSGSMQLGS